VFDVELRVRARLRHGVFEFSRDIVLPFPPSVWVFLHEGPDPDCGLSNGVDVVRWLPADEPGQGRFLVWLIDDVEAAATYGDDYEALREAYAARGWQEVHSGPFRVVGWPNPAPPMTA
jgi:hypothetical protein